MSLDECVLFFGECWLRPEQVPTPDTLVNRFMTEHGLTYTLRSQGEIYIDVTPLAAAREGFDYRRFVPEIIAVGDVIIVGFKQPEREKRWYLEVREGIDPAAGANIGEDSLEGHLPAGRDLGKEPTAVRSIDGCYVPPFSNALLSPLRLGYQVEVYDATQRTPSGSDAVHDVTIMSPNPVSCIFLRKYVGEITVSQQKP